MLLIYGSSLFRADRLMAKQLPPPPALAVMIPALSYEPKNVDIKFITKLKHVIKDPVCEKALKIRRSKF